MPELFTVVPPTVARERWSAYFPPGPLAVEQARTNLALGRVTAADLYAPADLPAFPRSTMDGYAVIAIDTYGASEALPAYLTVIGEVPMGRPAGLRLTRGQVAKVHTGGMLAQGADAVVMVEHTQPVDATTIEVVRPVAPGENVVQVGDDVRRGALLFPAGHVLRPQDLGGLLGLGVTEVPVARRPRVALIATGDEVVPPEQDPPPGAIRDINTYSLAALVVQAGAVPLSLGIVPDDPTLLRGRVALALEQADMVVISAGSSVSTRDMTADVLASLGEPGVLVHGIAVKPGKPTILAVLQGKPVIGLPGNPVSAMVVFDLLGVPAIARLLGCSRPPARPVVQARLAHNVASTTGREDYVPVRLEEREGEVWAVPVFGESNLITTLIRAEGLLQVPLDQGGVSQGELVTVRLF